MLLMTQAALAQTSRSFIGSDLPAAPTDLPATWVVDTLTTDRLLDATVILLVALGCWGIAWLVKRFLLDSLNRGMFTAVLLFVCVFGLLDPAFYQFKAVVADEDAVTLERYSAKNTTLAWDDVQDVRIDPGRFFPMFIDDSALVLIGKDGTELPVQRHVVDVDTFAALVHQQTGL
jgi:hypothetical protein